MARPSGGVLSRPGPRHAEADPVRAVGSGHRRGRPPGHGGQRDGVPGRLPSGDPPAPDPDGDSYVQVPYRTLSRPPVSAWEQGAAIARMRELGRDQVDENALFAMVEQMRQITDSAAAKTRRARRETERRSAVPALRDPPPVPPPPASEAGQAAAARPFEVIEQW